MGVVYVEWRRHERMKIAGRSPAFRRKRRAQIHSAMPNASAYKRDYKPEG